MNPSTSEIVEASRLRGGRKGVSVVLLGEEEKGRVHPPPLPFLEHLYSDFLPYACVLLKLFLPSVLFSSVSHRTLRLWYVGACFFWFIRTYCVHLFPTLISEVMLVA